MSIRFLAPFLALLLCSATASAQAQVRFEELGWMDRNHMTQQVESIDTLARRHFGRPVRGDKTDLEVLQRLVDQRHIPEDDSLLQQAMGLVLGNAMAAEVPQLEWKVYIDQLGRSRALCVRNTRECLFPITMVSRRFELGVRPNIQQIHDSALESIQPLLPRLPYSADTPRR